MVIELKQIIKKTIMMDHFLSACKTLGIKKVSIGMKHKSVKSSLNFGQDWMNFSIFADEKDERGIWPLIWQVPEMIGFGGCCGNDGQRQISLEEMSNLDKGVYHLIKGKWKKIQ